MKVEILATCLLLMLATHITCQSIDFDPRPNPIIQAGFWGDWSYTFSSEMSYLVCGAEMRFESDQGSGKDDTAANGLRVIFCNPQSWRTQVERKYDGLWGTWRGLVMCPENYFVDGFQVRLEDRQGDGDDTALNGLKFRCLNPETNFTEVITIFQGIWGAWRNWNYASAPAHGLDLNYYDNAYFFDSFQTRFQPSQGSGDDTALNGLAFFPIQHLRAVLKNAKMNISEQNILQDKLKKKSLIAIQAQAYKTAKDVLLAQTPRPYNLVSISRASASGGVTKFEARWWGFQLYLSHSTLESFLTISDRVGSLVNLGLERVIAEIISLQWTVFKVLDQNKGIILTRPLYIGPLIPTPQ